jgi:ribonuclease VapC
MIVVDSSALVAVLLDEEDAEALAERIRLADKPRISTANLVETLIVLNRRNGIDNAPDVHDFIADAGLVVESVTQSQAWLAGQAFLRFGRTRHPAGLNFGDCFAYALARSLNMPLLFKGEDFRQTDIRPAV